MHTAPRHASELLSRRNHCCLTSKAKSTLSLWDTAWTSELETPTAWEASLGFFNRLGMPYLVPVTAQPQLFISFCLAVVQLCPCCLQRSIPLPLVLRMSVRARGECYSARAVSSLACSDCSSLQFLRLSSSTHHHCGLRRSSGWAKPLRLWDTTQTLVFKLSNNKLGS